MNMVKLLTLAFSGSSSKIWSLKETTVGKSKKRRKKSHKKYGKNK